MKADDKFLPVFVDACLLMKCLFNHRTDLEDTTECNQWMYIYNWLAFRVDSIWLPQPTNLPESRGSIYDSLTYVKNQCIRTQNSTEQMYCLGRGSGWGWVFSLVGPMNNPSELNNKKILTLLCLSIFVCPDKPFQIGWEFRGWGGFIAWPNRYPLIRAIRAFLYIWASPF